MRGIFGILTVILVGVVIYAVSLENDHTLLGGVPSTNTGNTISKTKGVAGQILITEAFSTATSTWVTDEAYPSQSSLSYQIKSDNPFLNISAKPGIAEISIRRIDAQNVEICTESGPGVYYCGRQKEGSLAAGAQANSWPQAQAAAAAAIGARAHR